jgi:hypothetical protein
MFFKECGIFGLKFLASDGLALRKFKPTKILNDYKKQRTQKNHYFSAF